MIGPKSPNERLRNAYLEMPGLRLAPRQAARLCGLAEPAVATALEALASEEFLRKMRHANTRVVAPAPPVSDRRLALSVAPVYECECHRRFLRRR